MSVADPQLALLVAALDRNPSESLGLTLTVGGAVVSGRAVGEAAYWRHLAEHQADGLSQHFLHNSQHPVDATPTYVHLLDCAHWIGGPGPLPADARACWRGRLADVQGWTLGRLIPGPV